MTIKNTRTRIGSFCGITNKKQPCIENKKYLTCEELFPNWFTARIILTDFCNKMTDEWEVTFICDECNITKIVPPVINELTGFEKIPMHKTFPIEDQPKFEQIFRNAIDDYMDLDFLFDLIKEKPTMNDILKSKIKLMIRKEAKDIINKGGRSFVDELRFRLGVYPMLSSNIELKGILK